MIPYSRKSITFRRIPAKSKMQIEMSMRHWWHDTDRAKPKYGQNNLSQCHFTTNFTIDDVGLKPGLRGDRKATNRVNHSKAT